MATVKVKFRASSVGTGEGTLVYKVTHRRVTRQITTGYRLYPQEWDGAHSKVVIPSDRDSRRQAYLKALKEKIADDMTLFREIIALLDCTGGHYTADEVVGQYRIPPETGGFMCFARSLTTELKRTGRERTAERYTTVLNSFRRFLAERGDIPLNRIESALMVEYESHLKAEGICPNSSSFYMRGVRAVYNRAVDKKLVRYVPRLFEHVYTGTRADRKKALEASDIGCLVRETEMSLQAGNSSNTRQKTKIFFVLMFMLRGIPFVDLAYLHKRDLQGNTLSYRRRKTGRALTVSLTPEAMQMVRMIANKDKDSPYLFPILQSEEGTEAAYREYQSALRAFNQRLAVLRQCLGMQSALSSYAARHTWATMAYHCEIHPGIISEAMGHSSITVTETYLKPFSNRKIDEANQRVISFVKNEGYPV